MYQLSIKPLPPSPLPAPPLSTLSSVSSSPYVNTSYFHVVLDTCKTRISSLEITSINTLIHPQSSYPPPHLHQHLNVIACLLEQSSHKIFTCFLVEWGGAASWTSSIVFMVWSWTGSFFKSLPAQ